MNNFKRAVKAMVAPDPTFKKPVFLKVMDVSTCHITVDDNHLMLSGETECIVYDNLRHGFFVYVPDMEATELLDLSNAFKMLMHYARESGATHVLLDADGTHYPQLPTFDW